MSKMKKYGVDFNAGIDPTQKSGTNMQQEVFQKTL